jgi:hypothetical protein
MVDGVVAPNLVVHSPALIREIPYQQLKGYLARIRAAIPDRKIVRIIRPAPAGSALAEVQDPWKPSTR